MIEFGNTLRAAREAKGLSQSDIAQRTRMMIQTVTGLETEDFSRIVAPIYGRGFVKLYCEEVGLEPKPMIDAFMALYNGEKKSADQASEQQSAPAASAPARPAPAASAPARPAQASAQPLFDEPKKEEAPAASGPRLSRYAGNLPQDLDRRPFSLPSFDVNWRLVTLAGATIGILLLLFLATKAIYNATMTDPSADKEQTPAPAVVEERTDSLPPAADRKPLPVKPFYIDSDHSNENTKERTN